jgi:adenylylsulfate kinase
MLIAMAGLPGTGKSTLAARLAEELGGVVLNKDTVRAALFPPAVLDYSAAQDDLAMGAIFQATAYVLRASPRQFVILDGRTFLRAYQVDDVRNLAATLDQRLAIIECECRDEVARERLQKDCALAMHPAGNRSYDLYLNLKASAEPIAISHLVLDTSQASVQECVQRCLEYLRNFGETVREGEQGV